MPESPIARVCLVCLSPVAPVLARFQCPVCGPLLPTDTVELATLAAWAILRERFAEGRDRT